MLPLGGIITLLILIPNLLFLFFPPLQKPPAGEEKGPLHFLMEAIERLGQIGSFLIPFFFKLPFVQLPAEFRAASVTGALIVMGSALILYYVGWARYLTGGRRLCLLFAPMFRIPLPMAIFPILYFAGAAVLLRSLLLALAVVFLAVGHLFVSQREYVRCLKYPA